MSTPLHANPKNCPVLTYNTLYAGHPLRRSRNWILPTLEVPHQKGSERVTISWHNMKVIRQPSKNREQSRRKSINISFFVFFLRAKSNPLKYSDKYYRRGCVNRITYGFWKKEKKRMLSTWKRPPQERATKTR